MRERLAAMARSHPLAMFFALAYGFSWLVFVPMVLLEGPPQLTILASFGPTIAAVIVHRLSTGSYRFLPLQAGLTRIVAASAVGAALIILAFVVLPALVTADPGKLNWSVLFSFSVFNYSTLLGGPLGEEPGWRGYALPRMQASSGPVPGSLLLGFLWSLWHLPMFLRPGWQSAPLWVYIIIVCGLSIIMTFAANLSRFSVITAVLLHAVFNTVSKYLAGLFASTQPATALPFDLVMGLCGMAVALLLAFATKGRLGK
ncbi:MAG: CPBP family intramembrane glutamic endopeptidase [Bryobacteraceae bacterium]